MASRRLLKVVCKGWLEVTAGDGCIESSEKSSLSAVDLLSISSGASLEKLSMVRSIVGCATLFGVVVVGELVIGCVSFCGV